MRRVEKVVTKAVLMADLLDSTSSGVLAGEVEETCDVERSSSGVWAEEPFQHVNQSIGASLHMSKTELTHFGWNKDTI